MLNNDYILDLPTLMQEAFSVPVADRMARLLEMAGCNIDPPFVKSRRVFLTAIGGLPLSPSTNGISIAGAAPLPLAEIENQLLKTASCSAAMSYLSPPANRDGIPLAKTVLEQNHGSILHTVNLSIFIAGISQACETEWNVQRDLVHLSRVTLARTAAQDNPFFVLPDNVALTSDQLDTLRKQLASLADTRTTLRQDGLPREFVNALSPVSKVQCLLVTGSLRNLYKLVSAKDDEGKEDEYRGSLNDIHKMLVTLFPALHTA